MSASRRKYSLGREEIGILLSFAKRPEAATDEWMQRLQDGVESEEFLALFQEAGLPMSTALQMMSADLDGISAPGGKWALQSIDHRHALLGILAFYVIAAAAFSIATGSGPFPVLMWTLLFVIIGQAVYRAGVRLATR